MPREWRIPTEATSAEVTRSIPQRLRLIGWQCRNCSAMFVTKRSICPDCHSQEFKQYPLSGRGKIHTFTIAKQPLAPYSWMGHYAVAVVDLEEGPRAIGQIIDCRDEEIKIGMEVELAIRRVREEQPDMVVYMYKFRPVKRA